MKYSVIAALALGGLVATCSTTLAEDTNTTTAKPAFDGKRAERGPNFEKWAKMLSLTDEQITQAKPIWEKRTTAMKELVAKKLDRTEFGTQMKAIEKEFTDAMDKILTDEQKAKLKEMRQGPKGRGPQPPPQQ